MRISDQVNKNLDVVNDAFRFLDQPPLFENNYFVIDNQFSSFHSIRFASELKGKNSLPLDIYIESEGVRIDIFDIPESFEWNSKSIQINPKPVTELLVALLTGFSVIEFCGSPHSFSRLFVFGKDGGLVLKIAIRGWFNLLSTWKYERLLFFPIY